MINFCSSFSLIYGIGTTHLCFKQAQLKMCHSPKVDDGVDIFFKTSCTHIFGPFFFKNFKVTSYLNR